LQLADKGGENPSEAPDAPRPATDFDGRWPDVLAACISASRDGVVILDSDHRVVYANEAFCELVGYSCDRLLGQEYLAFVPEQRRQTVLAHWAGVRGGRSEPVRGALNTAAGSEVETEVSGTMLDLLGKQFFVFTLRDVTKQQRPARRAAALAQAAASVAASDSIDVVLNGISESALAGTRALAAWVRLYDRNHRAAGVGAAGVPDRLLEHLRSADSAVLRSTYQQALQGRRVVVYADWRRQLERALGMACSDSLPWQPAVIARLVYGGSPVGLLTAVYREGEMPYAAEARFLAALADQAATAAANARLRGATRESVALEERQRLAHELHDSVSQSLYAIQLGAGMARQRLDENPGAAAQPIDYVMRLAQASQAEMRAVLFDLRPEALESDGLVAGINRQIEAVRVRRGIVVQTIATEEPELHIEAKEALYRVAREALWNTVKHARARRVDVRLEVRQDSVSLEISDDGIGFDPKRSYPGHLGLHSMQERATRVGGSLEILSIHHHGTRVVVSVPMAAQSSNRTEGARPATWLSPGAEVEYREAIPVA
jgi:PAS domain S-box-containing protein